MPLARDEELKLLFTEAHTHNGWLDRPVDDAVLHRLYDLTKMAPTGGNAQPLRVVFAKGAAAKEKLRGVVAPGNLDKTMAAPVTAVIAHDPAFHEKLAQLFPARGVEMAARMASLPAEVRERLAFQSATLQAGYLILAARALGLDVGPMGGFDADKANAAFFPDGKWKSSLLVNLGYGDAAQVFPRNPRLAFDDACRIE